MVRVKEIKAPELDFQGTRTHPIKHEIIKKCGWCGDPFTIEYPNQRYCSDQCSEAGKLEKNRLRQARFYKKYGKDRYKKGPLQPGGPGLGPNPQSSFKVEYQKIQGEFQRLKLRKVGTTVKYGMYGFGVVSLIIRVSQFIMLQH